jgi:hypothetical protein
VAGVVAPSAINTDGETVRMLVLLLARVIVTPPLGAGVWMRVTPIGSV